MSQPEPQLEVCVDSASGIDASLQGGADRIELCAALATGGLTPSAGFMDLAARTSLPVHALVRPRAGNFTYSSKEVSAMCVDIEAATQAGLQGVAIGAASNHHTLDLVSVGKMCKVAGNMKKTLHRVFDTLHDLPLALDQAIDLGFDYILTSGGNVSVNHSIDILAALNDQAAGKITIVAGGGLTPSMIPTIAEKTGIREFHASCRSPVNVDPQLVKLGFADQQHYQTSTVLVRVYKQALKELQVMQR